MEAIRAREEVLGSWQVRRCLLSVVVDFAWLKLRSAGPN